MEAGTEVPFLVNWIAPLAEVIAIRPSGRGTYIVLLQPYVASKRKATPRPRRDFVIPRLYDSREPRGAVERTRASARHRSRCLKAFLPGP